MAKGRFIVISGPSGSGKTTVCGRLLGRMPNLVYSVSYTTRVPRPGEKNGKDYFFVSKDEFRRIIKEGGFLEYAEVFGNYYGTSKEAVSRKADTGKDVLLCIDVQGASQIKKNFPQAVLIFLMPPSQEVLSERLRNRATDNREEIEKRLSTAKKEMGEVQNYDYVVMNNIIDTALTDIEEIIKCERQKNSTGC